MQLRTLSFAIRLALAAMVATAITAATWLQIEQQEPVVPVWALITIALVVGVAAPADWVSRTVAEWTGRTDVDKGLKIEDPVKALLVSLSEGASIPWIEIGVTVFLVRRTRLHPFRGVQERVTRLRMRSYPPPTAVTWSWKKGLLGRCWSEQREVELDLTDYFASLGDDVDKEKWKSWPKDKRMRLSYSDFLAVRKFGYLRVFPIIKNGQYRGCIVAQVLPRFKSKLNKPEATEAIQLTAGNIANLL